MACGTNLVQVTSVFYISKGCKKTNKIIKQKYMTKTICGLAKPKILTIRSSGRKTQSAPAIEGDS